MRPRAGLLFLVMAAAALLAAWRLAPPAGPPIYDGCLAEPYRFLGASPAPTSTTKTYPATTPDKPFVSDQVITPDESPSQGQVLIQEGTFTSTEPFSITVAPVKAPRPAPPGEQFDGNVYEIVARTASGKLLDPPKDLPATIVLRGTSSSGPSRTILRLDGSAWTRLMTVQAGCGDTYEAVTSGLGDFAVVVPASAPVAPSGGFPTIVLIPVIVAVLVGTVFVLLRLNRPPQRTR